MTRIRRALVFTSAERYTNLTINFVLIAAASRLMSPAEIGVSAIGATIIGVIEPLRDVPTPFIVQQRKLDQADIASSFTCMLALTLLLGGTLFAAAPRLAAWYGDPRLAQYCALLALSLLPGPFERPVMAVMRREMAFDQLAIANVTCTAVTAATALGLAFAGFSYMSFGWAALGGNLAGAMIALCLRGSPAYFRPTLSRGRTALALSAYSGVWALTTRIPDMIAYLLLGRFLQMEAVGLYNRARILNDLPSKTLMSGLTPVVFPALAAEAREGRDLAKPYLLALSIVTALHWPAFLGLFILAHPIVAIMLGPQWDNVVPVVQIIALANLFSFSRDLTQPVLMAKGAFKDLLRSAVLALPTGILLVVIGVTNGLHALAWAMVAKVPIDVAIELIFVRRHVRFTWLQFAGAIRKSAVVTLCAMVGPALFAALAGTMAAVPGLLSGVGLAGIGWLAGLYLSGHPLAGEITLLTGTLWRRGWPAGLAFAGLRRKAPGRMG